MKEHYDIGVVGCWWGANYGSVLNGYAVYNTLKDLGLSVLMIHKHNARENDWEICNTHNEQFIKNFYPEEDVSPIIPFNRLHELNDVCDMFLSGSDQIWNYGINRIFDFAFMLNFVDDSKKKLSFGTSFGHAKDGTPPDKLPMTKGLLQKYSAVSVREQSGADICRDVYDVNAKVVVEPVFCMTKEQYLGIAEKSKIEETEPYIVTYILDPTPAKREAIKYYGDASGMKVINVLDGDPRVYEKNKEALNLPNTMGKIGTEDVMKLYSNASLVITDSFHGTAFALIFNKPFISITNFRRGAVRFGELLGKFEQMDRLAADPENIPRDMRYFDEIDYTRTNEIIKQARESSIAWLKNAVETPKDQLPSVVIGASALSSIPKMITESKKTVRERQEEYYKTLTTRPIVLMGAGQTAVEFCNKYWDKVNIQCVMTDNPQEKSLKLKNGRVLPVKRYNKESIREDDYIIVCRKDNVKTWYRDTKKHLTDDGFRFGRNFVIASLAEAILEKKKILTSIGYCHLSVILEIFARTKSIPQNYMLNCYSLLRDVFEWSHKYQDVIETVKISDILIYVPHFAQAKLTLKKTQMDFTKLLAEDAVLYKYPTLPLRALHPYKAKDVRDINKVLATIKKPYMPRPFQYEEPHLDALIKEGKSNEEILQTVLAEDFISEQDVHKNFKVAIRGLEIAEQKSDLTISDFILKHYQDKILVKDCLHYEDCVYFEIARRMAQQLNLCSLEEINQLEREWQIGILDVTQIPILPCVAKTLDIKYATDDYKYRLRLGDDKTIIEVTRKEWIEIYCNTIRSIMQLKEYKVI